MKKTRPTRVPQIPELERELKHNDIYSVTVAPEYRRLQYCFELFSGEESIFLYEDGFYTAEEADKPGRLKQYFKFPYLNKCDVIAPPAWVADTVWYQIMPDRFCRGNDAGKRFPLRKWEDPKNIHFWDGEEFTEGEEDIVFEGFSAGEDCTVDTQHKSDLGFWLMANGMMRRMRELEF